MRITERITFGSTNQIRGLFSFQNNCHVVCCLDQTLEQTVAIYLKSSIDRDGYSDSSIDVLSQSGQVIAEVTGSAAKVYASHLPKYLAIGQLGLTASQSLRAQNKWR